MARRGVIKRGARKVLHVVTRELVNAALDELNSPRGQDQLIHLFKRDWMALLAEKNRRAAISTYDFVDAAMPDALFYLNQFAVIASKKDRIMALDGHIMDLGVYRGESTRSLARIFPDRTIHGFDSFEGLPDDWSFALAGSFGDVRGRLPDVPANVMLHKGLFSETLPAWSRQYGGIPISLLRVDCDIYASTKTVFDIVGPLLRPGSWIVFDELIGYRGWQNHEFRAFQEFLDGSGHACEYVAFGLNYTIVTLIDGSSQS